MPKSKLQSLAGPKRLQNRVRPQCHAPDLRKLHSEQHEVFFDEYTALVDLEVCGGPSHVVRDTSAEWCSVVYKISRARGWAVAGSSGDARAVHVRSAIW